MRVGATDNVLQAIKDLQGCRNTLSSNSLTSMIRHKRSRSSSNSPRPDREFAPAASLAFSTSSSPSHHIPTTHADIGGIHCIHAVSVELLRPETLNRAVTGLVRKHETVNVLVAPNHRLSALGRDSPKSPLSPFDLFSVSAPEAARADINRLLNYDSRLEPLRESPDLVDQLYLDQSTGKPSPARYHAKDELQLVPWYYNAGKGGGLMESMDFTAFGVCLKQTRACTVAHLDLVTALVRSWEGLDMASLEEAHRCASERTRTRRSESTRCQSKG